jgi:hypothetical protein
MSIDFLSKDYLDQVKKRAEAATPGPWKAYLEKRDQLSGESFIARGKNRSADDLYLAGATDADIEFIAHAREDISQLLEEIERLKQKLNQV